MIWIKNALLVLVSSIVAILLFLLADYAYTLFIYKEKDLLNRDNGILESLDNGWYAVRSNIIGNTQWTHETIYRFASSKEGFRINPQNFDKPTERADIIFLGDSFTFGVNGPWEDTFVGMVEKSTGKVVLNAGVGSYSPTPYLHQYKKIISNNLAKDGHILIIGLDLSDVQDEARYWTDGHTHPVKQSFVKDGILSEPLKSFDPPGPSTKLPDFSRTDLIWKFLKKVYFGPQEFSEKQCTGERLYYDIPRSAFTWEDWGILNSGTVNVSGFDCHGYTPGGIQRGMTRVEGKLRDIAEIALANNATVYLLAYPWPAQLKYKAKFDWPSYVSSICRKIHCKNTINAFPHFMQNDHADAYKRYFVQQDVHYNKNGNQLVANAIIKELQK
jgi:hypothetical protein